MCDVNRALIQTRNVLSNHSGVDVVLRSTLSFLLFLPPPPPPHHPPPLRFDALACFMHSSPQLWTCIYVWDYIIKLLRNAKRD